MKYLSSFFIMVILSSGQIHDWDLFTIHHEPILSVNLMERAAFSCFEWLQERDYSSASYQIFCGKGNNGGDGLALARILFKHRIPVTVFVLETGQKGTDDFQSNLTRLDETNVTVHFIQSKEQLTPVPHGDIIIDALFGTGINRPLEGLAALLVQHLNESGNEIISIDMPSGLSSDLPSKGFITVHASHTLSFQCYKLAFMMAENEIAIGEVHILPIGLHSGYLKQIKPVARILDRSFIKSIYRPRKRFAHKGHFGHALIAAGSFGKMGAAVLATKACIKAGAGLVTAFIPNCGYTILQSTVPEAMVITGGAENHLSELAAPTDLYKAIGIGPGLGIDSATGEVLEKVLMNFNKPVVIDADALNILASKKDLLNHLSQFSILTPHPKEFDRLFGINQNDFERLQSAISQARQWNVIIVLKGHHTVVVMPGGRFYFNQTGNAGMATGGSGDVLTGIITSLLAQSYTPEDAALFGVYLHGLAGDTAAEKLSQEALTASDIIDRIGDAFLALNH
jgi:ADP-dependent NAD(P)H-hydrate dehydratase / NAD(P)H-hydrate epimerase